MRSAFLLLTFVAMRLDAQVIETPVPFDSAGKIQVLTRGLVNRFALTSSVWPVTGDFAEARLYGSSAGDTVLVVARRTGVMERHRLSQSDFGALRSAVNAALARTGAFVAEDASESARPTFTRNQLILGALLYGPGMAALANDARTGAVLYLVGAGGTFFAVSALSRDMHVTRAQNHLATDGALRGFALANGLLIAAAGDVPDRKTVSGVGLAGAVGGSIAGFHHGRRLSDAEAHAATSGSSFAALATLGALGAANALESSNSERGVAGALVAAGIAGYLAGPAYPRRARFTITAGDVKMLWVGAILATAVAFTPFADSDLDSQTASIVGLSGMLGGLAVMNATWVRSYDHTMGDVFQTWLGTIAGGLLGAALVVVTQPEENVPVMAMVTGGAILGAIASHSLARPLPAGERRASAGVRRRVAGAEVELSPLSVALAATKVRGLHPLIAVRF